MTISIAVVAATVVVVEGVEGVTNRVEWGTAFPVSAVSDSIAAVVQASSDVYSR